MLVFDLSYAGNRVGGGRSSIRAPIAPGAFARACCPYASILVFPNRSRSSVPPGRCVLGSSFFLGNVDASFSDVLWGVVLFFSGW